MFTENNSASQVKQNKDLINVNTASVVEIAGSFSKEVETIREKYTNGNLYSMFSLAVSKINHSMKVPVDIQEKAIIAMKSENKVEKVAGEDAFLFSAMEEILKTVKENSDKKYNPNENPDEMLTSVMDFVTETKWYIVPGPEKISDQVKYLIEFGLGSYFANKYDMPTYNFDHQPAKGIAYVKKVRDFRSRKDFTDKEKEAENYALELSKETKIPVQVIKSQLMYNQDLNKNTIQAGNGKKLYAS